MDVVDMITQGTQRALAMARVASSAVENTADPYVPHLVALLFGDGQDKIDTVRGEYNVLIHLFPTKEADFE